MFCEVMMYNLDVVIAVERKNKYDFIIRKILNASTT